MQQLLRAIWTWRRIKEGNSVLAWMFGRRASQWTCFYQKCVFVVWEEILAGSNQSPADTHPRAEDETSRPLNVSVWWSKTFKSFWWEKWGGLQKVAITQSLWTCVWVLKPKSSRRAEPGIDSHYRSVRGSVCEYAVEPTNPPENGRLQSSSSSILHIRRWTWFYKSLYIWDDYRHAHFVLNHLIDATHAARLWVSWFSLLLLLIFWLTWRELSDCEAGSGKLNPKNWERTFLLAEGNSNNAGRDRKCSVKTKI